MQNIRFINPQDFPDVCNIWQTCFGDNEAYIRCFWEHCFPLGRGLLYEQSGQPVAMLFLLPGTLALREDAYPALYVYAVATLPEWRGRGFAAALMRYAKNTAKRENNAALCLKPASERLYSYYQKLGYVVGFRAQNFSGTTCEAAEIAFDSKTAAQARQTCWGGLGYFAWAPPLLQYMHDENIFNGGQVFWETSGYTFCSDDGVKERCVCVPGGQPGGMILPLDARATQWLKATGGRGYLGLTLD